MFFPSLGIWLDLIILKNRLLKARLLVNACIHYKSRITNVSFTDLSSITNKQTNKKVTVKLGFVCSSINKAKSVLYN